MSLKVFIVFCSPAGSTRAVGHMIRDYFSGRGVPVETLDIGEKGDSGPFVKHLHDAGKNTLVFVGSPVYKDLAIPPVMGFVDRLTSDGAFAVPFVTWGQACSGLALWQLGQGLIARGFRLAGAAKVLAVHSMMWSSENPAGFGHPDRKDRELLLNLLENLMASFEAGTMADLDTDVLDYQPAELAMGIKERINDPLVPMPKRVNQDACTQCGLCAETCPVSAIALSPFPEFLSSCFGCFSCVKECPEGAIEPSVPLTQVETMIQTRIETIGETPGTRMFMP
ncbi:MAG: ferredoxin family protein [Proteobacteria bacterium]|nr:ferredoxin family protein [Pseudomonadota bacterium]